nr:threonine/serine exporter family protein [uncultured Oscillibacter sp.]
MDYDKLLDMAAELGYQLMYSGAEIYRVEESARRLLNAYGLAAPEVFAIPNCVIVSVATPQGHPITRMRRVPSHGTDIELLERCNALCRRLCAEIPPLDEARAAIDALCADMPRHSPRWVLLGYGVAPAFFAPLFGGGPMDLLGAFLCGLAVGGCLLYGGRFLGANSFFRTAVCSAAASLLAMALVRAGLGESVDVVTIAALMVLVPGMALTNAMREIMAGDTFSALSRAADAILAASAIALGAAAGQALGGLF